MPQEPKRKRPPRIPLSPEYVATLVLRKQEREVRTQMAFRKSSVYTVCNTFNVIAVFIYLELLLCYFFITTNTPHTVFSCKVNYGDASQHGLRAISTLQINGVYSVRVNDFISPPEVNTPFEIGKDFIMQRDLICHLPNSNKSYSIIETEPILFLSFFVLVFTFVLTLYNQNQKSYSLKVMALVNLLSLIGFLTL